MKKKFLDSSVTFIGNYKELTDDDIEKLRYGLEGIYLTITKLVIIVAVALLLGILKEVIITLILFNVIRYTGFGFHAEKSVQCLFISLFQFVILPYILINVVIPKNIVFIICIICVVSYFFFAPADTIKRPLPNMKKRKIRKWFTIFIGIIYSILLFIFSDTFIAPLFLSALIVEAIVINPLIYMAFGQPYNNYKTYVQALNI
ncbi:MAG: accessory gene regulator B family protein [Bacilli bacterium]